MFVYLFTSFLCFCIISSVGFVQVLRNIIITKSISTPRTAYLLWFSGAGKERSVVMTMHGYIQHMRVIIEHLLCAVAMVNILREQIPVSYCYICLQLASIKSAEQRGVWTPLPKIDTIPNQIYCMSASYLVLQAITTKKTLTK